LIKAVTGDATRCQLHLRDAHFLSVPKAVENEFRAREDCILDPPHDSTWPGVWHEVKVVLAQKLVYINVFQSDGNHTNCIRF